MIHPFTVPLTVRFRGVRERSGVLIGGPEGWAEFSPFPEYPTEVARRWAAAAVEFATRPSPRPLRSVVPVNTTIPAVGPEAAFEMTATSGCSTAKVKVAEGDDEERVAAVRDALGARGRIRIDVNGAWDVRTAAAKIKRLSHYGLEYVEQPVRTLEEMAELRKVVDVPLAADESIRTAEDPLRVAGLEAADIVVLKVQPLGGIRTALQISEECGLPVVVSSALETSIGLAMGLALAASLPELPYACGLGTATLLGKDVVRDPLVPVEGLLTVRRPEVDEALLHEARPDPVSAESLIERFETAEAMNR